MSTWLFLVSDTKSLVASENTPCGIKVKAAHPLSSYPSTPRVIPGTWFDVNIAPCAWVARMTIAHTIIRSKDKTPRAFP
jgi:hypothetical protein